ncbi:VWA domain-containing protein [Paucibacter sp. R3-3]|uniref:VWA domain-containing protein n=1 Tax=Roseateles agri TaxID=3098619 RepID=A0ABU5DPY6_9BURK|nr:VWA domain-containing protein [Paucibacter sp. R3-3]MDY0748384.1 VWA domain-containing protein [Paucibacter sp. R3-3]
MTAALPLNRRAIAALLCLPLVLPARATVLWPEPQPQTPATPSRPQFRAPSAASCDRPVTERIVPAPGYRGQDEPRPRRVRPDGGEEGRLTPLADTAKSARAEAAAPLSSFATAPSPVPATEPAPVQPRLPLDRKIRQIADEPAVTAGVVDDNADFSEYLAFRERHAQLPHRERDVRERYLLEVKDAAGRGVPDAEVAVRSAAGAAMWARTDTAGHAWLHPDAFDPAHAERYSVTARRQGREATTTLERGQKSAVELRLDVTPQRSPARLDLVFLVDATGSMGDEIDKLRRSMQAMVREIAALPSRPDLCLGLVAYRDRGDEFLIKANDLSRDLPGFQRALDRLQANGGGDYPEAMNEALADTVDNISWRGDGATRLVVLLADAPPHLDYGGTQYDQSMMSALGKGIKLFSVGASGLDRQGEYIQRQIAQYTGGRFVFLTYADAHNPSSGPGRETVHEVQNYSVETLDKLVVRLVSQELAALGK